MDMTYINAECIHVDCILYFYHVKFKDVFKHQLECLGFSLDFSGYIFAILLELNQN